MAEKATLARSAADFIAMTRLRKKRVKKLGHRAPPLRGDCRPSAPLNRSSRLGGAIYGQASNDYYVSVSADDDRQELCQMINIVCV